MRCTLGLSVLLVVGLLCTSGCVSRAIGESSHMIIRNPRTTRPMNRDRMMIRHPPPRETQREPGETRMDRVSPPQRDEHVVKPAIEPLRGRLTDAQKQEIARKALFDLQRMVICSEEHLVVAGDQEATTVARDVLATRLEELLYKVIATTKELPFAPTEAEQDRYRNVNRLQSGFLLERSDEAGRQVRQLLPASRRTQGQGAQSHHAPGDRLQDDSQEGPPCARAGGSRARCPRIGREGHGNVPDG